MALGEFIDLGFPDGGDPLVKLDNALTLLADEVGYDPGPTDPLRIALEGAAEMAADNEQVAVTVARALVRWIGEKLLGLTYEEAQPATATIAVTAKATGGGDIESGVTEVSISGQAFVATQDVTVAAGATEVVLFDALTPGEDANDLFDTPKPTTPLAWVDDWTLTVPTANGTEAETDDAFEARVARKLPSIGRPILSLDFEQRALDWPSVGRALVLDGYNADTEATGEDATVTVAVADPDGEALTAPDMAALAAAITAEREVGWVTFVIAPTYTIIDVQAEVTVWPGYDEAGTETAGETALTDALDPANFGELPTGETPKWTQETDVQRDELVTTLNGAEGVHHVETLLLAEAKEVTAVAATDVFTATGHGYSNTDEIVFRDLAGGTGITDGTTYFVRDAATDTFKVAATSGGAAIDITTDVTAGFVRHFAETDVPLDGIAPLTRPGEIVVTVV